MVIRLVVDYKDVLVVRSTAMTREEMAEALGRALVRLMGPSGLWVKLQGEYATPRGVVFCELRLDE